MQQRANDPLYIYAWGNNPVRAKLKGRKCRVLVRDNKMNTRLVEFIDTGERVIISGNALRRLS